MRQERIDASQMELLGKKWYQSNVLPKLLKVVVTSDLQL